jgi:NDP-sugar pyrophosphorylase family protein
MHYAILAAGDGTRLRTGGAMAPKPLTKVGREHLIERLIRLFISSRAESIAVIVNEAAPEVVDWVRSQRLPVPLRLLVRNTVGSMLSLAALSPYLDQDRFIVSTVDSVFKEDEFEAYVARFESIGDCDAMMGVTRYVDDDRPLYVDVDEGMRITSFEENPRQHLRYVSGGLYGLTPVVWNVMEYCLQANYTRMREFQRELVRSGLRVMAAPFSKIIDVDKPADIAKAEAFLAHGIHRDKA